jgi:hypothetical protein
MEMEMKSVRRKEGDDDDNISLRPNTPPSMSTELSLDPPFLSF